MGKRSAGDAPPFFTEDSLAEPLGKGDLKKKTGRAESKVTPLRKAKSSRSMGWPFEEPEENPSGEEAFVGEADETKPSGAEKPEPKGQVLGLGKNGLVWLKTTDDAAFTSITNAISKEPEPVDNSGDIEDLREVEDEEERTEAASLANAEVVPLNRGKSAAEAEHEAEELNQDDLDWLKELRDRYSFSAEETGAAEIPPEPAAVSPRDMLMPAVLPYLAAACFFALLAGAAVIYFVAVKPPTELSGEPRRPVFTQSQPEDLAKRGEVAAPDTRLSSEGSEPRQSADNQDAGSAGQAIPRQKIDLGPENIEKEAIQNSDLEPKFDTGPAPTGINPAEEGKSAIAQSSALDTANSGERLAKLETGQPELERSDTANGGNITAREPQSTEQEAVKPDRAPVALEAEPPAAKLSEKTAAIPQMGAPKAAEPAEEPLMRQPPTAATPQAKPGIGAASVPKAAEPRRLISAEQEAPLLQRGRMMLKMGDIAGARGIFEYLAQEGSSAGAFALAQTYDPAILKSLGVRGMKGDPKMARSWYEKASIMGSEEALAKLAGN